MKLLEEIIDGLKYKIMEAQELLSYLDRYGNDNPLVSPVATASAQPPQRKTTRAGKPSRKKMVLDVRKPRATKPAAAAATPPATVDDLIAKPLTIGGAMKKLIAGLNRFTGQELRDKLLADPPVAKLLGESEPGAAMANLSYWSKVGYLNRTGETPLESVYTVANRDFFTR